MLTPVTLQPGVYRNGTVEQSRARFYGCNLVRWREGGLLTQMGGWALRDPMQAPLSGRPRACLAWEDGEGLRWIAVGTHSRLYIQDENAVVFDVTPSAFVTGLADATVATGYGAGGFGAGTYGTERPDTGGATPASMWSFDLWNDRLVGVMAPDGRLVQWNLVGATPAAVIAGAPINQEALVVTPEGFLMSFAGRKVRWSDQADNTIWTPSDTNQARAFDLQSAGHILGACKTSGATLIVTSADAWTANYLGFPLVYGFTKVGTACGMVSRGALVPFDQRAAWMGREQFFIYDGFTRSLPCDIGDLVFGDINPGQLSKVTSGHRADSGEIWFNYCSAGSTEIDRQAIWNYRLNVWYPASIARSCMSDAGAFANPVMVSPDGYIHAHEVGFDYGGAQPFAETGPLRLGNGDRRMEVQAIVPDERSSGDFTLTFFARDLPTSPDTTHGPYALGERADAMFQAGRIRMRYGFAGSSQAVVGDFMLELQEGDLLL